MAMNFQVLINNMQTMGFFQYLFPFLLALAIIWGALQFSFKDRLPKPAMALVSIILSFFVMLYSSWNPMITSFFANLGGTFLVLASAVLFIVMIAGLIGFKPWEDMTGKNSWMKYGGILLIVFFLILVLMGSGAGWLIPIPYISTSSGFWTAVFVIAIIAIAFWAMSKGDSGAADTAKKEEPKTT